MTTPQSRATVARILRPHGRKGEVACEILTDFPEHLTRLAAVELWDGNAEPRHVLVRGCRLTPSRGGQAIFRFEGSDSISDAEKLVGLEVQIPLENRMRLPSGSYYVSDLIGCEVRDPKGSVIGHVVDVLFTGEAVAGTPVLVLDSPRKVLIPLAQEICIAIDVDARRIDVRLPPGLLDLNENS